MNPVPGLSVIIICLNEERDIAGSLESVRGLASEIVVVDSGSTDRTVEIARSFGARVKTNPFRGYGPQKQAALDEAAGPWVLNIDADERVTPALADEIRRRLGGDVAAAGFRIPFLHRFRGRPLRFGGAWGETHLRLFLKARAAYGSDPVHEGVRVDGAVGRLSGVIDHDSYRTVEEYLDKCNRYTSLIARKKAAAGARLRAWHHLRLPYEFFVRYVLKLGFLDGGPGLVYALLSSYYVWLKFVKIDDVGGER